MLETTVNNDSVLKSISQLIKHVNELKFKSLCGYNKIFKYDCDIIKYLGNTKIIIFMAKDININYYIEENS